MACATCDHAPEVHQAHTGPCLFCKRQCKAYVEPEPFIIPPFREDPVPDFQGILVDRFGNPYNPTASSP